MMLQKLCRNIPPQALDDEYDAIAVGVTCLAHHGKTSTRERLSQFCCKND